MVDINLRRAQRVALAGLILTVVFHILEILKATGGGNLFIPQAMLQGAFFAIPILALSVISFALSKHKASVVISIILMVNGGLMVADAITIDTHLLTVFELDSTVALFCGLAILFLGVVKTIVTVAFFKKPTKTETTFEDEG